MKDHLEPEILAAWLDGSLTDRERSAAEAHAADCDRCRGVLAAMVRTEPPAPSPFAWLSGFSVRWLMPVTAVGVALLVWNLAARPTRVAMPPPAAPPSAAPVTAPGAEPVAPPQSAPVAVAPERTRQAVPTESTADAARRAEPPSPQRTVPADTAPVPETVVAQSPPVTAAVPPAAAARVPGQALPPPPTPSAAPGPAPLAASPPSAKAAEPEARAAKGVPGGVVGGVVGGLAADRSYAVREAVTVVPPGEFASLDGAVRWRIGRAGRMFRSADGGKTWSAQNSGVTVDLLAGSAPTPDVCWVVGRAGFVLLSAASGDWKRIPFPEPVDLVAVSAKDAATASVTTVDGRLFTTADGGKSWRSAGR